MYPSSEIRSRQGSWTIKEPEENPGLSLWEYFAWIGFSHYNMRSSASSTHSVGVGMKQLNYSLQ